MSIASTVGLPLERSVVGAADPSLLPAAPAHAAPIPARRPLPSLACPRCKSPAVHRSRRRGFDWIMSPLGFLPARCFTCDRRFYTRQVPVNALPQRLS